MKRPIIFWDVDTQYDFMFSDGKLAISTEISRTIVQRRMPCL